MIWYLIREEMEQKRKARQALRYMHYPSSICYLAGDEINRPQRKRSAQWVQKKWPCARATHKGQRLGKKLKSIIPQDSRKNKQ